METGAGLGSGGEKVQRDHAVTVFDQRAAKVGTDETRSPCHENIVCHPAPSVSWIESKGESLKTPAFVLSLFDAGLCTARALADGGVPVAGFDPDPSQPGMRTRLFPVERCPGPEDDAALLSFLVERAAGKMPVLFPASDAFVSFIARNEAALRPHFRFLLPENAMSLLAKGAQSMLAGAAGARLPKTVSWKGGAAPSLRFPVYVKPEDTAAWRRLYGNKGARADGPAALTRLLENRLSVVVQEIIPGGPENNFEVSAYVDQTGRCWGPFIMRKLRQHPRELGTGTLGESVRHPELEREATELFRRLGIRGFINAEFKWDPRERDFKFIEANLRVWQQVALAAACGLNLPLVQYQDLAGAPIQSDSEYRTGLLWVDPLRDALAVIEERGLGLRSRPGFWKALASASVHGIFRRDDPWPALRSQLFGWIMPAVVKHYLRAGVREMLSALSIRSIKTLVMRSGVPLRLAGRRRRDLLYIFNYHRVLDPFAPRTPFDESGFGVDARNFRRQMLWVRRNFQVLSEDELIECLRGRPPRGSGRPLAMVTFDDGYIDNFTVAFPILRDLGLPAIYFVPTEIIESRRLAWWDLIAYCVKFCPHPEFRFRGENYEAGAQKSIRRLIQRYKALADAGPFLSELRAATGTAEPSIEIQSAELMSWENLRAVRAGGVAIGSHSHSHSILSQLPVTAQRRELAESKALLEKRLGAPVRSIAYPVGEYTHFHQETKALVRELGFSAAFSFRTGVAEIAKLDPFDLKRVHAPGDMDSFVLSCAFPEWFFRNRSGIDDAREAL